MPHSTFAMQPDGLFVDVLVGLDGVQLKALQQSGHPIPPPFRCRAILDTGADLTGLGADLLTRRSVPLFDSVSTRTAAGPVVVNRFRISLSLPVSPDPQAQLLYVHPDLVVTELMHEMQGAEVLIGLDVLSQGLLIYDGPGKQFTLAF